MNAVGVFDATNSSIPLVEFEKKVVTDSAGVGWELETDPAVLRALLERTTTEPFESIYEPV